jgi:hypothetical protein
MGYPKFIVFRVRLFLLAAVLGLAGANQLEQSEPDQVANQSGTKTPPTSTAEVSSTKEPETKSARR